MWKCFKCGAIDPRFCICGRGSLKVKDVPPGIRFLSDSKLYLKILGGHCNAVNMAGELCCVDNNSAAQLVGTLNSVT